MKEKLERIAALLDEAARLKAEIVESFGPEIKSVIRRYINAEHPTNHGYGFPSNMADFSWSVCGNSLCVDWDETWAYGGHDNGSFCVPISMFTDGGIGLDEFEANRATEKAEDARLEREKEAAADRRQLDQLQKKLGVQP